MESGHIVTVDEDNIRGTVVANTDSRVFFYTFFKIEKPRKEVP